MYSLIFDGLTYTVLPARWLWFSLLLGYTTLVKEGQLTDLCDRAEQLNSAMVEPD